MKLDLACGLVVCVQGDDRFQVGKCYPAMGFNNGLHIAYTDKAGNMVDYVVHNYDDDLINPDDLCNSTYPIFKYFPKEENGDEEIMKRGYPNPNYTEEDIREGVPLEMNGEIMIDETVVISPEKFERMCYKAAALDILTSSIQRSGEVKDDIVLAVTGAIPNHDIEKLKKENSNNWDYYWKEKQKVEALEAKCSQLETARKELIEILKQNKIGPYADQPEGAEVTE